MARVLFVCPQNAGRSLMAEAFFHAAAGGQHEVRSAGTNPAQRPHDEVVEAMRQRGVELSSIRPRRLELGDVEWADLVVTLGCADAVPEGARSHEDWTFPRFEGDRAVATGKLRDAIADQVTELVGRLEQPRHGRAQRG